MGKTYVFECGLCHYRAKISGGGDSGVDCEVQTIACRDCRELFDVFRRARRQSAPAAKFKPSHPEIPPVALPGSPARANGWQEFKLACPVNRKHLVEPWNDPGRCPRCGNYLEKNGLPFRLWD
jgi:hypothetical protein